MRRLLRTAVAKLRLYRLAACLYETYRLVARPHTHGALVAIWWDQRLLLVQASYRNTLSLPGGGLEAGETPRQAAVRELSEELGIAVSAEQLLDPWQISEVSARGRNTLTIYALRAERKPAIRLDGLEIVRYHWLTLHEAQARPITSHLRDYLSQQAGANNG